MRKIHWHCEIEGTGFLLEDELELPDDYNDFDVEDAVSEAIMNYLTWGWEDE